MPNWCSGIMILHGRVSNLYSFIKDGLIHEMKMERSRSDGHFEFTVPLNEMVWIVDQRGFCTFFRKNLAVTADTDNAIVDLELDYSKAWNVDAQEMLALCKKFALDVQVYASEYGNCFRRRVLIYNEEIIQDETIEWNWYDETEEPEAETLEAE